ncbi:hypothetical protein [Thaumasiovibrio subtropicus]|uniref:hypothetical protein n=1 Tax=Thaumasiovibrio subtropicus TaxID=1891207 RepID=UPI000B357A78|nr:hypothetical protein [Thaumasiovibrio subtropicus]
MSSAAIPSNYQEWKHCITVECGLELTPDYISQRIEALQTPNDHYTKQFTRLYGEQYLAQVLAWFKQARAEVA